MDTDGRTREVQGGDQRAPVCGDHMQGHQVRKEGACLFPQRVLSYINIVMHIKLGSVIKLYD